MAGRGSRKWEEISSKKLIWNGESYFDILYHSIGTKSLVNHNIISPRQHANLCLCVLVFYPLHPMSIPLSFADGEVQRITTHTQPPNA